MPDVFRRTAGYFAAFIVLGMVVASLGPTLPYLADKVNVTLASAGFLFTARSLGYMSGSLFAGRGYDRIPGNILLASLLVVMAFCMTIIPFISLLSLMAIVMFIAGFSMGGTDVGCNTMVAWIHGERSGLFLNTLFFFFGIGALIIPLITSQFQTAGQDVRWAYWIIGASAIAVAMWLISRSSPQPRSSADLALTGSIDRYLLALFGFMFFIYIGLEVSFGGWIYTYILAVEVGDIDTASLMTSLFWIAMTIGRLIAIPVAARLEKVHMVRLNLSGALLSLGIILVFPSSLPIAVVGTFALGLSLASNFPTTYALAERSMNISGKLTGLLWACGSLGAMFTPWFIGLLFDRINPLAFVFTLFFYVCVGYLIFWHLSRHIRRTRSTATSGYPDSLQSSRQ
jgi:FHS family Na+ dependent glucose MFS transporter 1